MTSRWLRTRYDGACCRCRAAIPAVTGAWWDAATRTLRCATCGRDEIPADGVAEEGSGSAGRSAQREYERRRARRADRVRADHPRLGGLLLALSSERQSTRAWAQGAEGERLLGARLDGLCGGGAAVLHDRRIPGRRANIDHLVVAPSGIWVIDAKHYTGVVSTRDVGGWRRRDHRLYVGRRDCTGLIAGMAPQVAAVTAALGGWIPTDAVRSAICFVGAEWSLLATPLAVGGITVTWPEALVRRIGQVDGQGLTPDEIAAIAQRLDRGLSPA